ncbi:diaminopimelate epimerase [Natrialbaceae archaeon A-chndr2]
MSAFADIPFEKYHGTGNDFLVIDAETYVPDRRGLAARECNREAGVGADGVLYLALEDQYSPPRVIMTLVQPDGGTAPMCGNGARVAGQWAMERTGSDEVMIDTQSGTRHASREGDRIAVEMGVPTFQPRGIPATADGPLLETEIAGLEVSVVNTGVPHAVAFVENVPDEFVDTDAHEAGVDRLDAVDLDAVAKPVRHADIFPLGTNVVLASPNDQGGFDQRTFERGVEGETDACGTGAVAIAAVARRLSMVESNEPVPISPIGGDLEITFDGERATLIGPVVHEFDGTVKSTHFSFEP